MTESTAHRIEPEQLRAPLRTFGYPVDRMDDRQIQAAALHLAGVGQDLANLGLEAFRPEDRGKSPGALLRKLADFCETIEGLAAVEAPTGEKFRIEISAPYQPALIEEDFPVDGIELAAQLFAGRANPSPSASALVDLVEELAQNGEIRQTKADGRTVVARLVPVGVEV